MFVVLIVIVGIVGVVLISKKHCVGFWRLFPMANFYDSLPEFLPRRSTLGLFARKNTRATRKNNNNSNNNNKVKKKRREKNKKNIIELARAHSLKQHFVPSH